MQLETFNIKTFCVHLERTRLHKKVLQYTVLTFKLPLEYTYFLVVLFLLNIKFDLFIGGSINVLPITSPMIIYYEAVCTSAVAPS